MKKKQIVIIAAALAVVLLTGTAVYAVGNLGSESNQANKPVEQPSLSAAAAEAEELQAPLTAEQVDISAFTVPIGTEAEQILRNTLVKKQMTEQEIQYYNALPSEIKMMTRAEAIERLEELNQWLEENQKEFSEYTSEEKAQLNEAYNERLACRLYIDCLATGSEHAISRIDSTLILYEGCIAELVYLIADYPDNQVLKNEKAMFEFLIDVLYDLKTKAQNGEYDYQTILDKLQCVEGYFDTNHDYLVLTFELSEETFDDFAQRYESGESIESILG
mgnify:CR=1 FL=1